MNQEKINRINELYKKQKAGTITTSSHFFALSILPQSAIICETH